MPRLNRLLSPRLLSATTSRTVAPAEVSRAYRKLLVEAVASDTEQPLADLESGRFHELIQPL